MTCAHQQSLYALFLSDHWNLRVVKSFLKVKNFFFRENIRSSLSSSEDGVQKDESFTLWSSSFFELQPTIIVPVIIIPKNNDNHFHNCNHLPYSSWICFLVHLLPKTTSGSLCFPRSTRWVQSSNCSKSLSRFRSTSLPVWFLSLSFYPFVLSTHASWVVRSKSLVSVEGVERDWYESKFLPGLPFILLPLTVDKKIFLQGLHETEFGKEKKG